MPLANINGFTMYYETQGEGFPLVYVHGGFGGLGTGLLPDPLPQQERFSRHFKVITYDRRASGRSSYPENGFTMENLARDIRELLRHLGHARAHIFGSSVGGHIALAFGLEYPEAAASLGRVPKVAPCRGLPSSVAGPMSSRSPLPHSMALGPSSSVARMQTRRCDVIPYLAFAYVTSATPRMAGS